VSLLPSLDEETDAITAGKRDAPREIILHWIFLTIHKRTQDSQRQVSWMKLLSKSAAVHPQSLIAKSADNPNLIERRSNSRLLPLPPMLGMAIAQALEVLKS